MWVSKLCTQERSFSVNVFDKLALNMISCSEAKEDANEEDGKQENSLGETDKTVATLEAMLMCLNWGKSLVYPMRRVSIWSQP